MIARKKKRVWAIAPAILAMLLLSAPVLADTDGSEIRVAEQPDRLILQLGLRWAGVQFELKTDAGVFPIPIVVDETGLLKMDLGGSRMYTLSCLASATAIPGPDDTGDMPSPSVAAQPSPPWPGSNEEVPAKEQGGAPFGQILFFFAGAAIAACAMFALYYIRGRRAYDDDDYDAYDEYGDDD